MRVLLISPLPPPIGGIATWTKEYLMYCKKNKGIKVFITNTSKISLNENKFIKSFFEIIRTVKIIVNSIFKILFFKIDVIHINSACSKFGVLRDTFIIKFAKRLDKKIIFHCHCNIQDSLKIHGGNKNLQIALRLSSKIFVLNYSSKKFIKENYELDSIILPNFIKTNFGNRLKINDQIKNVVFVGHMYKEKGISELIDFAKMEPKIKFTMVGDLTDFCLSLNISRNVDFIGSKTQQEVIDIMRRSDVLLLPSYSEGFPLVVLEAMSVGLPVVATKVGAVPDMLEGIGKLLNTIDVNEIHKAFFEIEKKDVRENMSQKSIEKVEKDYDINIVMPKIIELYE